MTIVRIEHLRKLKYCARGVRKFFEKYNLDYQKFLNEGITEKELMETNDAMAFAAIEEAKK
jgi:hypothetical protein